MGVRERGQREWAEGEDENASLDELAWRMTVVIVSVHHGCLVWRQAKLRNRDDRVTHSGRMGKPTAPLTLYFSERGGRRAKVSSHLHLNMEYPAVNSPNSFSNILLYVYCLASVSAHFWHARIL